MLNDYLLLRHTLTFHIFKVIDGQPMTQELVVYYPKNGPKAEFRYSLVQSSNGQQEYRVSKITHTKQKHMTLTNKKNKQIIRRIICTTKHFDIQRRKQLEE